MFYGSLYHLNSEESPEDSVYLKDAAFHRSFDLGGMLETYATSSDNATINPRGRIAHSMDFIRYITGYAISVVE